jgi:hypothetical protein
LYQKRYNFLMEIADTPDIEAFLDRCFQNLLRNDQNDYLDVFADPQDEAAMQSELAAAGQQEFDRDPACRPSLFLKSEAWKANPFVQRIQKTPSSCGAFSYTQEIIPAGLLFNADAIQPDRDRELKDWMKLRAMDRDTPAFLLKQDEKDWMIAAPSEAFTNDPPARAAHGRVLTFGLGIGYFPYMVCRNPAVTSLTVVEKAPEVIRLFEEGIRPQLDIPRPLTLLQGDAGQYWNQAFLQNFDFIYVDIWQSSEDGLVWMDRLLEQAHPRDEALAFWIEDSCLEPLRTQLFLHMAELARGTAITPAPAYARCLEKVRAYARTQNRLLSTAGELKDLLYDRRVLRAILAEKI